MYVLHLLQIIMVGTEKFSLVLSCRFLHIWFLVHLVINIFVFDFGRLQKNLHFLQKRQENTVTWCIFGYSHYVIKYLMRDMVNYHCLRVFRSRVSRIEKHSPRFSVFRISMYGCSDAELCRVPIQRRFFFLAVSISHARQVMNK